MIESVRGKSIPFNNHQKEEREQKHLFFSRPNLITGCTDRNRNIPDLPPPIICNVTKEMIETNMSVFSWSLMQGFLPNYRLDSIYILKIPKVH